MSYGNSITIDAPFADTVERVRDKLQAEGFGVLTEIDMQATLSEKIGKELDAFVIVGACNPDLAGRALDAEPQIGVLLPCNVVVRQAGGDVIVEAMDPGLMATIAGTESVRPIADEARRLVSNALERLGAATT